MAIRLTEKITDQSDALWLDGHTSYTLKVSGVEPLVDSYKLSGVILESSFRAWLHRWDVNGRVYVTGSYGEGRITVHVQNDQVEQFERELFLIMLGGLEALKTL